MDLFEITFKGVTESVVGGLVLIGLTFITRRFFVFAKAQQKKYKQFSSRVETTAKLAKLSPSYGILFGVGTIIYMAQVVSLKGIALGMILILSPDYSMTTKMLAASLLLTSGLILYSSLLFYKISAPIELEDFIKSDFNASPEQVDVMARYLNDKIDWDDAPEPFRSIRPKIGSTSS